MARLAQLSGVPAATIKHYLREGLLPPPDVRTGRNMAFYDAAMVERVKAIKVLQREHFLPLKVIKGVLTGTSADVDAATAAAIERALEKMSPGDVRTRAQLLAGGLDGAQLDFFLSIGLLTPERVDGDERYSGDDLALLRTLGAARRAGISPAMLPAETIEPYLRAIRELVRTELAMFRDGVVPRAGLDLTALTETATRLSEQLVVLVRRKLLLPTLQQLVDEEQRRRAGARAPRRSRTKTKRSGTPRGSR
ncbi:MAG: hypothetical protein NVS3B10_13640 [Polyangiales bacterium]